MIIFVQKLESEILNSQKLKVLFAKQAATRRGCCCCRPRETTVDPQQSRPITRQRALSAASVVPGAAMHAIKLKALKREHLSPIPLPLIATKTLVRRAHDHKKTHSVSEQN